MTLTTYAVAKAKVLRDLDLEDEVFIQSQEMLDYFNEALREACAEVLAIYEDYFLDKEYLALTQGQSEYDLPTGIYANKIRAIIYDQNGQGTLVYEIKRIRDSKRFLSRSLLRSSQITDYYQYIITNNSASGRKIELSPSSRETSSQNVTVWFIRNVDPIVDTTDYVDKDIPESLNFIYAFVKGKCKQKEAGGEMPPDALREIEQQRKLLVETLTTMVPDDDNKVEMDTSFYDEMS